MTGKTIICCAVTGSGDTRHKNPAVPVTPAEIAESAIDAARAGAAIVHIHVRDPETGKPSMALEHYREAVERIRQSGVEVILNLTTGAGGRFLPDPADPSRGAPGTNISVPARRVAHVLSLKPEICSLDMGSLNIGITSSSTRRSILPRWRPRSSRPACGLNWKSSRPGMSCLPAH
jgi:uncharacterized protein (DUF849 family)